MVKLKERGLILTYKIALISLIGAFFKTYTYINPVNFSTKNLPYISLLILCEEIINYYLPTWFKEERKAKFSKSKDLILANPVNIEGPGKELTPAHPFNLKPSKKLTPAHHEL